MCSLCLTDTHTCRRSRHSSRLISSEAPTDLEPTVLVFVPGVGRTSKAEEHHRRGRAEASDPFRNTGWRLTNDKNLNQTKVSLADVSPVERASGEGPTTDGAEGEEEREDEPQLLPKAAAETSPRGRLLSRMLMAIQ